MHDITFTPLEFTFSEIKNVEELHAIPSDDVPGLISTGIQIIKSPRKEKYKQRISEIFSTVHAEPERRVTESFICKIEDISKTIHKLGVYLSIVRKLTGGIDEQNSIPAGHADALKTKLELVTNYHAKFLETQEKARLEIRKAIYTYFCECVEKNFVWPCKDKLIDDILNEIFRSKNTCLKLLGNLMRDLKEFSSKWSELIGESASVITYKQIITSLPNFLNRQTLVELPDLIKIEINRINKHLGDIFDSRVKSELKQFEAYRSIIRQFNVFHLPNVEEKTAIPAHYVGPQETINSSEIFNPLLSCESKFLAARMCGAEKLLENECIGDKLLFAPLSNGGFLLAVVDASGHTSSSIRAGFAVLQEMKNRAETYIRKKSCLIQKLVYDLIAASHVAAARFAPVSLTFVFIFREKTHYRCFAVSVGNTTFCASTEGIQFDNNASSARLGDFVQERLPSCICREYAMEPGEFFALCSGGASLYLKDIDFKKPSAEDVANTLIEDCYAAQKEQRGDDLSVMVFQLPPL